MNRGVIDTKAGAAVLQRQTFRSSCLHLHSYIWVDYARSNASAITWQHIRSLYPATTGCWDLTHHLLKNYTTPMFTSEIVLLSNRWRGGMAERMAGLLN